MNPTITVILALLILPAIGLALWAWFTMSRVDAVLGDIGGFEAKHFELGPQARDNPQDGDVPSLA
jgi:hypothetical protein